MTTFSAPELRVPLFFRTKSVRASIFMEKNSGTQVSANLSFGHPFHRQFLERKSLLDRENKWFWDHYFSRLFAILKTDF